MKDGKAQVFPKGVRSFDAKKTRQIILSINPLIPKEEDLRFSGVDLLAKMDTETMQNSSNSMTVCSIISDKQSKVICKKEMGNMGGPRIDRDIIPPKCSHFIV